MSLLRAVHALSLERFPLYHTYRDLELICNYYKLTDDPQIQIPIHQDIVYCYKLPYYGFNRLGAQLS